MAAFVTVGVVLAVASGPKGWALVAGLVGVLLAYRWPFPFVILTLWTFVIPTIYVVYVGSFGLAPYVLLEGCALCGMAGRVLIGGQRLTLPPGAACFALYAGLTTVSAVTAIDRWAVASMLVRFWLNWLMLFLILAVVTDRRRLRWLLAALIAHAIVIVGMSIGAGLDRMGLPGLPNVLLSQFQKNDYATYLAFVAALGLLLVARAKTWPVSLTGGLLLLMVAVSWPLTYSRSGFIAILTTLSIIFFQNRTVRFLRMALAVPPALTLLWLLLPANVTDMPVRAIQSLGGAKDTVSDVDSFSNTIDERMVLNLAALDTIRQRPFTGIGLGNWQAQSPVQVDVWDVKAAQPTVVGAVIHNQYLLVAAESGLLTLAAYLAFVFVLLRAAYRARRHADAEMRMIISTLAASVTGLLVSVLFIPGSLWQWNLLGFLAAAEHVARREQSGSVGA
jgi:O-antigen ligase